MFNPYKLGCVQVRVERGGRVTMIENVKALSKKNRNKEKTSLGDKGRKILDNLKAEGKTVSLGETEEERDQQRKDFLKEQDKIKSHSS